MSLPVCGNSPGRSRCRLIRRMMLRRRQFGPVVELFGLIAPEPRLAWFVARHDRVPGGGGVRASVLRGRAVTAPDVPALSAPAQVQPPPAGGLAVGAAGPGRRCGRVNTTYLGHTSQPFSSALWSGVPVVPAHAPARSRVNARSGPEIPDRTAHRRGRPAVRSVRHAAAALGVEAGPGQARPGDLGPVRAATGLIGRVEPFAEEAVKPDRAGRALVRHPRVEGRL